MTRAPRTHSGYPARMILTLIFCSLVSFLSTSIAVVADDGNHTVHTLLQQLSHWDQQERRSALQTIQLDAKRYATPVVRAAVQKSLDDSNCGVRTIAAETLTALAPYISIQPASEKLLVATNDAIASVRKAAVSALCAPAAHLHLPETVLSSLQEDPNRQVRIAAKHCAFRKQNR